MSLSLCQNNITKACALRKALPLYAITDRRWLGDKPLAQTVKEALLGGVTMIQLREKNLDTDCFLQEAQRIKALCHAFNVPFIVNDNIGIALACDADGVHIGQQDMAVKEARALLGPEKILGVSAKTTAQALAAENDGADYLGVGAVFPTDSKANASKISHNELQRICAAVSIPVVAIGGINEKNISKLQHSSISGAAVISAIFAAPDIRAAATRLRQRLSALLTKTALTIAGSDASGGAGIQADLKTMLACGVYGMSAITALTAQNTTRVAGVSPSPPDFLSAQLDSIFDDIFPDAVKTGMVFSAPLIAVIAGRLRHYQAKNIVVDPVMVATSGARLLSTDAITALKEQLFPLATLITPNLKETEALTGLSITNRADMETAARKLQAAYGCNVLCKGGHRLTDADDLLYTADGPLWLPGRRVDNPNTHGTGCTLSAAIAAHLAKGYSLPQAVQAAKDYLTGALTAGLNLGHGAGPLHHGWNLTSLV
ncbi:MAG: bifunctional hydroxymethylpyrimidine kinase/phosphomethylpyrimidine kinase [Selenomonas ruminantium]|jgi:hydroxymethylpyrimidine kinase/phosphomethylpyrimidine kinase/thiamine-phosphate diphosphorylase|nr:bifunctional hydroxymethylpyrimidine kinase/phosphomethylpyrimidine kinase [Selenomonas ruminantium]